MAHIHISFHGKLIGVLLSLALVGAAVTSVIFVTENNEAEGDPPVAFHNPFGLYSPGTLDQVPTSARLQMLGALGLSSLAAYQDYSLGLVRDVGVSWVRIDFIFDGWKFLEPSAYLEKLHRAGIEVMGCAQPLNSSLPADLTTFQTGLKHLVHQYPWIKVWQIGNEPNISMDNPGDYPRLFLAGRDAVRNACPDCRVALAGAATRYPSQPSTDHVLQVYDGIIAGIRKQTPAGSPPFDIFDLHYYGFTGSENDIVSIVQSFRDLLAKNKVDPNTDLWVTETATSTGQPSHPADVPSQTESQQAAELVERFTTLLAVGASHVSWSRPYENYRYGDRKDSFYDHSGLVYNGLGQEAAAGIRAGTKKKAFFAYRTLIEETRGATQMQRLGPGRYRFLFNGRGPLYVLWSNGPGPEPADLFGQVTVVDLTGRRTMTSGEKVTLSATPVFVETG